MSFSYNNNGSLNPQGYFQSSYSIYSDGGSIRRAARELIDALFTGRDQEKIADISPAGAQMRPLSTEVGLPLPLAGEPVNPYTGRRLVYFGSGLAPVEVLAEPKNRFVAVVFKDGYKNADSYTTVFGTVLGYSDDDSQIIWQNRSDRYASTIFLPTIQMIHRALAFQCRHCGCVLLRPELREHTNTHKKGSGVVYGVFHDDDVLGNLCGDSGLVQNISSPKRLGEGAQGVVDLCKVTQPKSKERDVVISSDHLKTPLREVVVKTMNFEDSTDALEAYQQSVRFLTGMSHPHLVEYLAVQLMPSQRQVKIYMPFYSEGDIAEEIRNFKGKAFPEHHVCSIALQLSEAISFLHDRNPPIVHGDIKVENVMMYNKKEQIVLMDLDASREVKGGRNAVKSNLGTAAYMAPETMNNERLMPASDMWSLGVFLYVLMVLPEYPGMIINPVTQDYEMFNSEHWASAEDLAAIEKFTNMTNVGVSPSTIKSKGTRASSAGVRKQPGMSFADCVRSSIAAKGFSASLTKVVVDLLSYNPLKRPTAIEVKERLVEIMTEALLSC